MNTEDENMRYEIAGGLRYTHARQRQYCLSPR